MYALSVEWAETIPPSTRDRRTPGGAVGTPEWRERRLVVPAEHHDGAEP